MSDQLLLPAFAGVPEVNRVYHCDALMLLKASDSESVNCVVTSPPYNLRNSTGNGLKADNSKGLWTNQAMNNGYADGYADNMPHDEYVAWQRSVLVECLRVLKSTGAIFYNHKWRVQGGVLQRLVDEITDGLPVRQIIIWSRGSGMNFNTDYFLPTFEVIYLIAKPEFKLQPGTNAFKDVWHIPPVENKAHPNAFPLQLAERCVLAGSAKGDLVVDPFCGIGTALDAAQRNERRYLGCDISAKYVGIARQDLSYGYTPNMFETLEVTA